ncbi:hypothetical protein ACA1_079300 [Medusavirus stheno T3]|uniref:Uncharacterized protein n=1 Tax=Medusavirus stheno T3 TaxID=3069717 RepID=A0A7S8BDA6_9VIRU|nr:hypothetical protein ACA1_079300 [Acanthamoeba castellanii medusavirus]QPB44226.1 hypothetical protein ACA1_079300 [Medusavirus stheno T3]
MQQSNKRPLVLTEKEKTTENPAKRPATDAPLPIEERVKVDRERRRAQRLRESLHSVINDHTHEDVRGTTTRLWRNDPEVYEYEEVLAGYNGEEGSVQAFIDKLPIDQSFNVVSSTFDADKIAELLATENFRFHAFMFAPHHLKMILLDRENDECLFRVTHGPERELNYDPIHDGMSESLVAVVHEETNPRRRKDLSLVAAEHRDDAMRPVARVWLEYPNMHRSEAPPQLRQAIASAMLDYSFFVMTGEGACQRWCFPKVKNRLQPTKMCAYVSALHLQSPGYLPRANLYMRVKGVSTILE